MALRLVHASWLNACDMHGAPKHQVITKAKHASDQIWLTWLIPPPFLFTYDTVLKQCTIKKKWFKKMECITWQMLFTTRRKSTCHLWETSAHQGIFAYWGMWRAGFFCLCGAWNMSQHLYSEPFKKLIERDFFKLVWRLVFETHGRLLSVFRRGHCRGSFGWLSAGWV